MIVGRLVRNTTARRRALRRTKCTALSCVEMLATLSRFRFTCSNAFQAKNFRLLIFGKYPKSTHFRQQSPLIAWSGMHSHRFPLFFLTSDPVLAGEASLAGQPGDTVTICHEARCSTCV